MMDGGAGHAVDHAGVSIKPVSRDSALTFVQEGVPRQARPGYFALAVHHHERLRLHRTEDFPAALYRTNTSTLVTISVWPGRMAWPRAMNFLPSASASRFKLLTSGFPDPAWR